MNPDPGHNVYHNTIPRILYNSIMYSVYNIYLYSVRFPSQKSCMCTTTMALQRFQVSSMCHSGDALALISGSIMAPNYLQWVFIIIYLFIFFKQPLILVRKNSCVVKNNGMYSFIELLGYDSIKEGKWWSHRHGNIRLRVTINILKVCHTLKFNVLHSKWASWTFNRVFTF